MNKVNLQRYGTEPLEFAKSKNAIELAAEAEVSYALIKVCEVVELGDFDALLEKQAQFGRRVTQKNKLKERTYERVVYARSSSYNVQQGIA
ncbi:hypothetical protein N9I75_03535 [Alphaproteobacteria bacterium]|nr:hypothetical protein [Alphaproteobacteria bacterium]